MTQWGGFACGPRGDHRADCHVRLVDDDASNEECHQWSALGNRQVVAWWVQALAPRLDSLGQGGNVHVLRCLGIARPSLLCSTLVRLAHLRSFPLALRPFDPLRAVHIEQPSVWAFERRADITPWLTSGLSGVGQPCAHLCPCQCMGDAGRRPQHAAEVLPAQCVSGVCGRLTRRAAVASRCPQRIRASRADVRVLARGEGPTGTRQATRRPADATTPPGRVRRLVATCPLPMTLQAVLGGCEGRVAHDGRHWQRHPCLPGGGRWARACATWRQGRCAPASRDRAAPATLGHPRRGG